MQHLGSSRSVSRRDYLLHTPDAFVRTPLPGLAGGQAIVHVAPQMGARFAMMSIELEAGGVLTAGPAQRFVYVLSGSLRHADHDAPLQPGSFCLLPAEQQDSLHAERASRALVLDKHFAALVGHAAPAPLFGKEEQIDPAPLNGDTDLQVRSLLPAAPAYDFAVNTMTYAPGAALSQVEAHYMEHGLLMLEGAGIYRLGNDWHPVQAGDVIWMGAFCPQWFAAVGKVPAKYLIYKDWNRHVLA